MDDETNLANDLDKLESLAERLETAIGGLDSPVMDTRQGNIILVEALETLNNIPVFLCEAVKTVRAYRFGEGEIK